MYTFSSMMFVNSRKHHFCVRPYTREVLVFSANLEIQIKHYPFVFSNRRGDEERIKKTWDCGCVDLLVSVIMTKGYRDRGGFGFVILVLMVVVVDSSYDSVVTNYVSCLGQLDKYRVDSVLAGFLDSRRGGKKNNKHGEQPAGKKINTIGALGLVFGSNTLPLVDDMCTVHIHDRGLNDVNTLTGGASNTGPISVTNIVKEKEISNASGIYNGTQDKNLDSFRLLLQLLVKRLASMSFATLLKGDSTRKGLNFHTLITLARNEIDVVVPLESIRVISQRFVNTAYGFFWESGWLTPLLLTMLGTLRGRSSYTRAMIEIRIDVELKDTIVVAMPKLVGDGFYTCNICVEYEWKPPMCACCKVFGHVHDESPKNIDSDVAKNLKKPSQAPRGVSVGHKIEKLIIDGKITLVDDEGKPRDKVDYPGDHDSGDEVESVDNEMTSFLASEKLVMATKFLTRFNMYVIIWISSYGRKKR
uniref:Zinc knuckle CX2CX4HX4C n=1 Tax=Tanacetum cinerariifolium TaxID=118510 RepID=A0A6L2P0Z6_TANCI|nr:hypothetical protein [Tanacetum cinerariifolium]